MQESVTPNGLEKCTAFTINESLIFIDSMQFMNSSLDILVTNLSDNDFKHFSREFSVDLLKFVEISNKKECIVMNILTVWKKF